MLNRSEISRPLPERAGYLILLFLHKYLTPEEAQELDDWVTASDENMELFEELINVDRINFIYRHVNEDISGAWILIGDEAIPFKTGRKGF